MCACMRARVRAWVYVCIHACMHVNMSTCWYLLYQAIVWSTSLDVRKCVTERECRCHLNVTYMSPNLTQAGKVTAFLCLSS